MGVTKMSGQRKLYDALVSSPETRDQCYMPGLYVCPAAMLPLVQSVDMKTSLDSDIRTEDNSDSRDLIVREEAGSTRSIPIAHTSKDSQGARVPASKASSSSAPYRTSPPYRPADDHSSGGPVWNKYYHWCLEHTCYPPEYLKNHTCQRRSNNTNRAPGGVIKAGQRKTPQKDFECFMCFDREDTSDWIARHCKEVADHGALHFAAAMGTLIGMSLIISFVYLCRFLHQWIANRRAKRKLAVLGQEEASFAPSRPERHVSFLEP